MLLPLLRAFSFSPFCVSWWQLFLALSFTKLWSLTFSSWLIPVVIQGIVILEDEIAFMILILKNFIYLTGRVREKGRDRKRKTENFHLLTQPLKGHNGSWSWAGLRPQSKELLPSLQWWSSHLDSLLLFSQVFNREMNQMEHRDLKQFYLLSTTVLLAASPSLKICLFVLMIFIFIWQTELERVWGIFHPLVHSANGCNSQIWVRLKPGVKKLYPALSCLSQRTKY